MATVQCAETASRKNLWMNDLPGMDIRISLGREALAVLTRIEFNSAVVYPASSKIAFNISVVDDFPFVPVTAITVISRDGKPNANALTYVSER